jgi:polyferredoxin
MIRALLVLCAALCLGAGAPNAQTETPSLAELEALMAADEAPVPSLKPRDAADIAALAAFLALAVAGFWRKSAGLKLVTMIAAVAYMGFAKGNLVSLVHIFNLIDGELPALRYNIAWYALMAFTLVSTVLWGRLYCGRVCAFGAFTQLMDRVLPKSWRWEPPRRLDAKLVYLKYVVLAAVVFYYVVTQDKFVYKYVEPFWMFTLTGDALLWAMVAALLLGSVFIRNFYCRYLCSVGAALGLLSHVSVFRIRRWRLCASCKLCEKTCEWGAIKGPKVAVGECVRCDDCEVLYADKARCPHWLLSAKNRLQRALLHAR